MPGELACHTHTSLLGGNVGTEVQYFSSLLFQVCTTRSTAVSGKHVHRGR